MRADIHDGPEHNALLQDRISQVEEASCNARPEQGSDASCHSSG